MNSAFFKAGMLLTAVPWEKVPWTAIVNGASRIMDTALKQRHESNRHKERQRPNPDGGTDSLPALRKDVTGMLERLDALEGSESAQAELISKMAAQEETLLRGLQAVSTRVTVLYWALAATVTVAAIALLFALL